nr:phosphotransferase [Micromonospora pisi]
MTRRFVEAADLTGLVREAFGTVRRLDQVVRLRGGSKKGVYRLLFDDDSTAILYVWNEAENYWPEVAADLGTGAVDPFADASDLGLFEAASEHLGAIGVRTPRVYLTDRSRRHHPADLALVEEVHGGTLEALLRRDPEAARPALTELAAALTAMGGRHSARLGKLTLVDRARQGDPTSEQIVLERALRDLESAATRVQRLANVRERLADTLRGWSAVVPPRTGYGLIHGELGPDHVLLDDRGRPVLIDIEGLMYFDQEWEHAFLELRFGEHYHWLRGSDLDEDRLRFYRLAMHLSLVAGPLRLLDGDFPDRELMAGIAEHNTGRILRLLG